VTEVDALVVGSGPNGLAAAVTLAQAGLSVMVIEAADTIGGGTRSAELTLPGLLHDVCSAVHPFGAASPYLASLPLADHGLQWRWPEVDRAHPLDGGRAGVMKRSIDATATGLGDDAAAWRRSFGAMSRNFPDLATEFMQPLVHLPKHPVTLGRFGLKALQPATRFARRFRTEEARALFAGVAAHMFYPLNRPLSTSIGAAMIAAGHDVGWPVPAGGSQSISAAMASLLTSLGGTIRTGASATSLRELPRARLTMFDTSPATLLAVAGDAMTPRLRKAFSRYEYGPAAYKVDLAVEGGIPWRNDACRRAGTVHIGGTLEEIAASEAALHQGRLVEHPFILLAQQYLCDPQRSVGDVHPIWAYAHVPNGYTGDATGIVLDSVERFAPGFRDRIVGHHVMTPADFAAYNANYVGGDISSGANSPRQIVFRPHAGLNPYATGIPGVYLCSSATPPGPGVHGMCGHHAARSALKHLGTRRAV
jgi:phytoene dehydrogenase-like protein